MHTSKSTTRLLALCAGMALASTASAAVSVSNSTGALFALPTSAVSVSYDVINANSVLVIGFYIDVGGANFSDVTYGGQAPDGSFSADRAKLYFFKNPTTAASAFSATSAAVQPGSNNGYFLWELAGVDLTAPVVSATGTGNGLTITTTTADAFVVDIFTYNNSGTGSVPDAVSDIIKRSEVDMNSGLGGGYIAAGDFTAVNPGLYNLGWTPTGTGFGYGEVALAFAPAAVAIPEPSSFALLAGLAGLGITLGRRRR